MNRLLLGLSIVMISASIAFADALPPPRNFVGASADEPWWSETGSGWVGGILGSTVGIIGGILGTLAGLGTAKRVVVYGAIAMICFGVILLLAGIAAVVSGQPYHVYFPLLLTGSISALVFGLNLPTIRRRYEQQELQRMSAMDA